MSLRSIRKFDDPILKQVCRPAGNDRQTRDAIADLRDTIRARIDGVGLAAPQIGIDLRIIAIQPTRGSDITILVNPKVIERSAETETKREGCLSYPGVWVDIARHWSIRVAYDDVDGRFSREYQGFEARIIQHEIDHLNGICLVGDAWRASKPGSPAPLSPLPSLAQPGGSA